ncbi:hypothetical protein [Bradyrhizobium sp. SYSU BS000235]|uniref:hypothetical protein n=1 Tax=Bradyrhizobium sp. SYSU BS000235 TaxID=3411332 RepID=UPI003C7932F1
MGADFSIRPVGTPVPTPIIDTAPAAAKAAVQTQLPADKAVTAPDAAQLARNNANSAGQSLSNKIMIDRDAAQIVYQTVDSRTSLVVNQFPDESRLRARAYLRAQDEAKRDNAQAKKYTDRQA